MSCLKHLIFHCRQPIGHDPRLTPGLTGGDFLTETWFIALLGSMVAVMVLLFAAMLLVRRRQLLNKKSALSNINGKQKNDIKIWYHRSVAGKRKSFFRFKIYPSYTDLDIFVVSNHMLL
jgi:ribosomal protein S24E